MKNSYLIKLIIILIVTPLTSYSFNPALIEEFPESSFLFSEQTDGLVFEVKEVPKRMIASLEKYPSQYRDEILFWKRIYTKYPDEVVLIHDKLDLGLIYKVLNFSKLKKNSRNLVVYEILKNRALRRNVSQLKNQLKKCNKKCKRELLKNKKYNT